jgi:ketosteroid isomerase-like protein
MSAENVDLVRSIYAAFKAGDVPGVVARMAPDMV